MLSKGLKSEGRAGQVMQQKKIRTWPTLCKMSNVQKIRCPDKM